MRVHFIDLGGIRTRYYEAGEGLPVVFVHGGGAAADTWARSIGPMGRCCRALAPDLIGHGFTDARDFAGRTPHDVQKEHLFRFLDAVAPEPVVLVGSAFGALLAALMYFEAPERIAKLVLVGSGSVFDRAERQAQIVSDSVSNQSRALNDPTPESIRARNVGSNFDKADTFEEIVLLQLTAFALPGRKETYRQMTDGMRETAHDSRLRVSERLEMIDIPTLVITGRDDPRADWREVEKGASRIPGSVFHLFEKCGHKPFSEQSAKFNDVLSGFISG